MKKFNVTGICIPEEHYMVDISKKIEKIEKMVDEGAYFTINRPRQYGKTLLTKALTKGYWNRVFLRNNPTPGIPQKTF